MSSNNDIELYKNVSLKDFTTIHIGGKAKYLYIVHTTQSLIIVCKYCTIHNIKYKIIGLGANLIFSDDGYDGAIIVNKSNEIIVQSDTIIASSGVSISYLLSNCTNYGLSGIESLAGIPSTLGGAVVNNLGAFLTEISNYIEYVECYHKDNLDKILTLSNIECQFSYRNSVFKSNKYIITRVKLKLTPDSSDIIKEKIKSTIIKKSTTQPLDYPSAGSVFKRRESFIPSKIIDELGLKGKTIGDAMISTKHAGFILNLGNATSHDYISLVNYIKNEVLTHHSISIDTEVEFVDY